MRKAAWSAAAKFPLPLTATGPPNVAAGLGVPSQQLPSWQYAQAEFSIGAHGG